MSVSFRVATADDARFVWRVNNQPDVRAQSISTESIPWDSHVAWYARKLADPSCIFFIAVSEGEPIGVIRFETAGATAIISIALDAQQRGKGFGTELLSLATAEFLRTASASVVVASVRPENVASSRAFRAAGYVPLGPHEDKGVLVERFEKRR